MKAQNTSQPSARERNRLIVVGAESIGAPRP
jgi:hypothetical protein